jgi:hypothetical protein
MDSGADIVVVSPADWRTHLIVEVKLTMSDAVSAKRRTWRVT